MPTYVNDLGQPDPNGPYELINGKKVLRDGRALPMAVFMIDGKPQASTLALDAEVALNVSQQRRSHQLKFGWMGDRAPIFDEQAARLIATSKVNDAANRQVRDAAANASYEATAKAAYDTVKAVRRDEIRNGWKTPANSVSLAEMRDAARNSQHR